MDKAGNLYGTTSFGGANNAGTVFELLPNSRKTAWTHKLLYSFCSVGGSNCTDGAEPVAGLIMDSAEDLFGTTWVGGAHGSPSTGGTVFELTPNSNKTAFTYAVVYSFCSQTNCEDGEFPTASLVIDLSGKLYGTASAGGAHSSGTAFELAPNSKKTAYKQNVLYSFCSTGGKQCTDGSSPYVGLIMNSAADLFGVTQLGGANNKGAVFELKP